MKKQDNQGFSLIELLVAVVILAVVVVPLLHGFLSSYRVNSKSKSVLRATTLAQNEMETFEKEKIEDLIDPAKFDYTYSLDEANGVYTFVREGITTDSTSPLAYDVAVTLNPMRQGDEADPASQEKYYTQNNEKLLLMNTISAIDSGTYIQPVRTASGEVGLDSAVYGEFVNFVTDVNKDVWKAEKFATELKRDIYLEVKKGEDGVTRARVIYDYVCTQDGIMKDTFSEKKDADGNMIYRKEVIIYDNSQMFDEEGNRIELKCLYLFYAPRYGLAATNPDTIHVINSQGLPVEFYIIRQDILEDTSNTVAQTPMNYRAMLEITDILEDNRTKGFYRTNLNIAEMPANGLGQQIEQVFVDQTTGAKYLNDQALARTGLLPLDQSEAKDRIFVMQVNVYAKGGYAAGDKPLVTLDGTKLE